MANTFRHILKLFILLSLLSFSGIGCNNSGSSGGKWLSSTSDGNEPTELIEDDSTGVYAVKVDFSNKISQVSAEGKSLSKLAPVSVCKDFIATVKERVIHQMEEKIEQAKESALNWGCEGYYYDDVDMILMAPPDMDSASGAESASAYSETNTQEKGVDEADFIKNDGSTIFMISDGKFKIIDAWPPETARIISEVEIEGTPKRLYVYENRAIIYSSIIKEETENPMEAYYSYRRDTSECTYGYNCDFTGDNHNLKMTVLDITDMSQPKLIRDIHFSGAYINSRRIGSAVHSVVFFPEIIINGLIYWPELMESCWEKSEEPSDEAIIEAFDALKKKNREIIEAADIDAFFPQIIDTAYKNGLPQPNADVFSDRNNLYFSNQEENSSGFLCVVSMDMEDDYSLYQTTILGGPGAIYATDASLYVTSRQKRYSDSPYYFEDMSTSEATIVHKFNLENDPATSSYSSSGIVKGRVLNQFSMSEYNDIFRIATTTGYVGGESAHNTMTLLEEKTDGLEIVGQIDNIAPSEDIRSVRFDRTKAYMVTFKKTDPLYVFDLENPVLPTIESALKIPGFSTYMHLMDENHLLTIGYDADDQESFAWFSGIMLQIFDVSDMTSPKLIHKQVIGTRGSSSEAATNHLAFNYFEPKKLFALPITVCEGGSGGDYGYDLGFSGLYMFNIDIENGFTFMGGVSHLDPDSEQMNNLCGNWWTDSGSVVKRTIFMDDYVYSVSTDEIIIRNMNDLEEEVNTIDL